MDQATEEAVVKLRNAFLDALNSNGSDFADPRDVERLKKDNDYVARFLKHQDGNFEAALQMIIDVVKWRKEFKTNDIRDLVKMDIIIEGGFFPHGRDKDGCSLFIFKCKKYKKGSRDADDLKRCVVYWFERLEKEDKGKPITLVFDMGGCGLANMDLEFTKYLIGLFKEYYPKFLNYIIIFEMPWILNAAFQIIKSWLPEKAIEKIKFVSKKDVSEFIPLEQALTCWGGLDDYTFSFIPEEIQENTPNNVPIFRKVHFADGSSMSESPEGSGEKEYDGSALVVQPSNIITFTKDGLDLVSTLELHNTDPVLIVSFKLKTTSPEKFRVRPSVGCLHPGEKTTVCVTLLPGFQLGGLSRDKFLVMSTVIEPHEISFDLVALWRDTTTRKVHQHRLKCAQSSSADPTKNASNAVTVASCLETNAPNINQILASINKLTECQSQLHGSVDRLRYLQYTTLLLLALLGGFIAFVLYAENPDEFGGFCRSAGRNI